MASNFHKTISKNLSDVEIYQTLFNGFEIDSLKARRMNEENLIHWGMMTEYIKL